MKHLLLAMFISMAPAVLGAQETYSCLPSSEGAEFYLQSLREIVTGTDSLANAQRTALQLPVAPDTSVELLSDSTVCRSAAQALAAVFPAVASSTGGLVYRVGDTRYVIIDPKARRAERIWAAVLDQSFGILVLDPAN